MKDHVVGQAWLAFGGCAGLLIKGGPAGPRSVVALRARTNPLGMCSGRLHAGQRSPRTWFRRSVVQHSGSSGPHSDRRIQALPRMNT